MGARQTPERTPFFAALSLTVSAARAHGLTALDSVHNEIEDLESLAAACRQGADFGFDGKNLIHPSHLAICNAAFTPDPAGSPLGACCHRRLRRAGERGEGRAEGKRTAR